MTLPDERYRSLRESRLFLYDLLDPQKTPGVAKIIREQARALLRHYPTDLDLARLTEACPEVLQTKMEPLSRLMAQYRQGRPQS